MARTIQAAEKVAQALLPVRLSKHFAHPQSNPSQKAHRQSACATKILPRSTFSSVCVAFRKVNYLRVEIN